MPRVPRPARRERRKAAERAHIAALLQIVDAQSSLDEDLGLLLLLEAEEQKHRCGRHGPRGPYNARKSEDFFDVLFEDASERIFKSWLRMSRAAFWRLHGLIENDPVFQSEGKRPQYPVKYQLAMFLMRCGGEQSLHAACALSVSEGSAYNFQDRVVHAFRLLRNDYLAWPTGERLEDIKDAFALAEFPGCVGIIDGSLIRLRDRPLHRPWCYYCRKKYYALAIQAVCDHRRRFISYELGWPGSVSDVTLLKESHLWRNIRVYFTQDEYVLADKGYPLTPHFIRPFGEHELAHGEETRRRKKFNYTLSKIRIEVEHAFGNLKGRFPILRMLPGHDLDRLYRLIEALMVVHNILIDFGDDAEDLPHFQAGDFDRVEDQDGGDAAVAAVTARQALLMGMHRRKILLNRIA